MSRVFRPSNPGVAYTSTDPHSDTVELRTDPVLDSPRITVESRFSKVEFRPYIWGSSPLKLRPVV